MTEHILEETIDFGHKDLDLRIEGSIDGEVVFEQQAESFVRGFIELIYAMMGGPLKGSAIPIYTLSLNNSQPGSEFLHYGNSYQRAIIRIVKKTGYYEVYTNPNNGMPTFLPGIQNVSSTNNYAAKVLITGVQQFPQLNGVWDAEQGGYSSTYSAHYLKILNWPDIDVSAFDPNLNPNVAIYAYVTATEMLTVRYNSSISYIPFNYPHFSGYGYSTGLYVGSSDTPVKSTDDYIQLIQHNTGNVPYRLDYSNMIITTPVVSANSSEIVVSRTIINRSTTTVCPIREVGVYSKAFSNSWDNAFKLIARDIVSIDLDVGKTLNISYKLRTTTTSTSGLLQPFNEILYRQLSSGQNREAKNVNNSNIMDGSTTNPFYSMWASTGDSVHIVPTGIVFGTGDKPVAITDYGLRDISGTSTLIPQGIGDNMLNYIGKGMDGIQVTDTEASMKLYNIVENKGTVNITIKELGLYVSSGNQVHCIYRRVLDTPIVVAPNEILRTTLTLVAEV